MNLTINFPLTNQSDVPKSLWHKGNFSTTHPGVERLQLDDICGSDIWDGLKFFVKIFLCVLYLRWFYIWEHLMIERTWYQLYLFNARSIKIPVIITAKLYTSLMTTFKGNPSADLPEHFVIAPGSSIIICIPSARRWSTFCKMKKPNETAKIFLSSKTLLFSVL